MTHRSHRALRSSAVAGAGGEGCTAQRPLWASTVTKDPAFSDVLYVERLIAPAVVNTMPEKTLHAFADQGDLERALDTNLSETDRILEEAAAEIDRGRITEELEREGVKPFCDSYHELLDCIESTRAHLGGHDER